MKKLHRDELFYLACKMDIYTFIKFSKTCKDFYKKIYKEKNIWCHKLEKDFPNSEYYISYYIAPREFNSANEKYIVIHSSLQKEVSYLRNSKNIEIDNIYYLYYILNPIKTDKKSFYNIASFIVKVSKTYTKYIYILYSWISLNLDHIDINLRKVINTKLLELGNLEKGLLKKFGFLLDEF